MMRRRGGGGGGGGGGERIGGARGTAAGTARYKLQSVTVSGFKSWTSTARVVFGHDGLSCITGPNGSGKSTLLNAILFGLGENANQLGAKQNAELASAAHAEVELLFRGVSRGVSDAKVSSAVSRANGQRTYAFNGQRLPKHRFDHFLRTRLGIATGNPFWRVSQDGIHRLLQASPHELHESLCEVSGTKAINAHRSNALRQLARWRRSLADIQGNIDALEEAVGREGAYLQAMDRVRELTTELEAIPGEMEALDREIARAEHAATERLVVRLGFDVEALEREKSADDDRIRGLQAEMTEAAGSNEDRGGDGSGSSDGSEALQKELSLALTGLAEASVEVRLEKAALREKEELNGKWLQILEAARRERVDLDAKSSAMRGRCAVLKERRGRLQQEVDRSRAQLFTIAADGGSVPNGGSGGGSGSGSGSGADGALRAARRVLDDHQESVKRAESRRATLSAMVSRAEAEVEERTSQVTAANALVDEVWGRMRQIGSPLRTAEDAEKYLRGVKDQRSVQRERQLDLSRALESSRQSLAAARCRIGAPQWCSQLVCSSGGSGGGHRGFLFEVFEIRRGLGDEVHLQALASLLAGSLSVWVCESPQHADQALDLAKSNATGLRVWPIARLKAATRTSRGQGRSGRVRQALEWAERKWPGQGKVTDPASLLAWDEEDEGVTAAVDKALGAWLITADDDTSALVLDELGMSSVTLSGVRHAPGEVVGGAAQGEGARLRAKLDWDLANHTRREGEASLEACVEACRDLTRRLESGTELAGLQARRTALKKEASECTERLAESQRKAAGARQKLEWADSEKDRLEKEAESMGQQPGKQANPEEVVSAMRNALEGRQGDLDTTKAACAQMDKEIGSLAEASMEALERENNAKEALGMHPTATANDDDGTGGVELDDDDEGEDGREERMMVQGRSGDGIGDGAGGGSGGSGGSGAAGSSCCRDGGGVEEEEAVATAGVRDRLSAMKRALERKISRVEELERRRDELTARLEEATAREEGAGERASKLEEEMADAKTTAADTGARLRAKRKSLKESERRVRQAAARLGGEDLAGPDVTVSGGSCSGGGGGGGGSAGLPEASSFDPAVRQGASSAAITPAAVAAAAGGVTSWEGTDEARSNDKENFPAKLSEAGLLGKKHQLAAKQKLLSTELRGLRRQSGQRQQHQHQEEGRPASGSGAAAAAAAAAVVVAGSVDEVTVTKRRAKVGMLKQQLRSVLEGTRQLEAGVVACEGRMHEANEACYASVRGELRSLFGALCRNKSADLVMAGPKLEDGLRLVVRNVNTQASAAAAAATTTATPSSAVAGVVERAPQELSGGQQALLGLALVLALSSYQAPPLCLLDEVDAALDETNQAAAARLVALTFREGQALCVSHHADFHRQSGHCVAVEMRDGVSRVQTP